jgi:hypothetical protein
VTGRRRRHEQEQDGEGAAGGGILDQEDRGQAEMVNDQAFGEARGRRPNARRGSDAPSATL